MAAKGYAGTAQVERWYGSSLTAAQAGTALAWLETAESVIDAVTGQPFGTGAVVQERHLVDGPTLFLRQAPVSSVGTVLGWSRGGTAGDPLVLTSDYEQDSLPLGQLYIRDWVARTYDYVTVAYTPGTAIPAAIGEATAALVADWLANGDAVSAASGPVVRRKAGDVEIQYGAVSSGAVTVADLPARVQQLLTPYLGRLTFA